MYKLQKIDKLKNYRFFQDFTWDENNCKVFNKFNIIYGWNGSGKTTLCDFFKEIENKNISECKWEATLSFFTDNNTEAKKIHDSKILNSPCQVKVFHKNYVEDAITKSDAIEHIFVVGREQKKRVGELEKLKTQIEIEAEDCRHIKNDINISTDIFERMKTSEASNIKRTLGYSSSYNKNRFFERSKQFAKDVVLSEEDYNKKLLFIRAERKGKLAVPTYDFIHENARQYISSVLSENPINKVIESLQEDTPVNAWVESGLDLHEKRASSTCLFCGNKISDERFENLRAHFNKSYLELSNKINKTIESLEIKMKNFKTAKRELPPEGLMYDDVKEDYRALRNKAAAIASDNIEVLEGIIKILEGKKSNMVDTKYLNEFENSFQKLHLDYSTFDKIVNLIENHNAKTADFVRQVEQTKILLEKHLITEAKPRLTEAEKKLKNRRNDLLLKQAEVNKIELAKNNLEKEIMNSQIPAEAINRDISFIMGRDELVFEDVGTGYQIMRKGVQAENLSKGEENAIALIYFFNALSDRNIDISNTILVLDDPISSFDTNFYYSSSAYIRGKASDAGQVFIFTHKFTLFKDFAKMFKENSCRYIMKREGDSPKILDEDKLIGKYYDEYAYLFKEVFNFVKNPPNNIENYFPYPNIGRRLLEGFLTFKIPNEEDMMQKVYRLEGHSDNERAILRLLNERSHKKIIPDKETSEDVLNIMELPKILGDLLIFLEKHDKIHFEILAKQCEQDYEKDKINPALRAPKEKRKLKLYELSSITPLIKDAPDKLSFEYIETDNAEADFAVKIPDSSMEPKISANSTVLVKSAEELTNADIGIFFLGGEAFCRKMINKSDRILLVAENRNGYQNIDIPENEDLKILGKVIAEQI